MGEIVIESRSFLKILTEPLNPGGLSKQVFLIIYHL